MVGGEHGHGPIVKELVMAHNGKIKKQSHLLPYALWLNDRLYAYGVDFMIKTCDAYSAIYSLVGNITMASL